MSGLIYDLMEILDEQNAHFNELIVLSAEKKELIIKNDTTGLSELTNRENALTGKVMKLDKKRSVVMNDIANVLGRPADSLTLTALAEIIQGQGEYERLEEYIESIRGNVARLKTLNEQNRVLIEHSLEYIDFTINVIRGGLTPGGAFYSSTGEELGPRQGFFDAKQ